MRNSTTDDFSYDPVTAVDETSATGKTAEILPTFVLPRWLERS